MFEPQKGKKTLRKILMLDKISKRDKFLLRDKKSLKFRIKVKSPI